MPGEEEDEDDGVDNVGTALAMRVTTTFDNKYKFPNSNFSANLSVSNTRRYAPVYFQIETDEEENNRRFRNQSRLGVPSDDDEGTTEDEPRLQGYEARRVTSRLSASLKWTQGHFSLAYKFTYNTEGFFEWAINGRRFVHGISLSLSS